MAMSFRFRASRAGRLVPPAWLPAMAQRSRMLFAIACALGVGLALPGRCGAAPRDIVATVLLEDAHAGSGYDDPLAAVVAAGERFLMASVLDDREHVGAVLRGVDGRHRVTHGLGARGQDRVTFRIDHRRGEQVVALWHTHGAPGPWRALFSPEDRALVLATGLPFYLVTPDGEVKVLRPEEARRPDRTLRPPGAALRPPAGAAAGVLVARLGQAPRRLATF